MELLGDFEAGDRAPTVNGPNETVDPREARHQLLKKIFEAHCLLDIRFATDQDAYQSAIIELVPEAGYLVIDTLTPTVGNTLAALLPAIRLRTRLHGMEIKFASAIVQHGSQAGLPYYKVRYPHEIEYPQRRRSSRVTVPFDRGVPVRFQTRNNSWVRGEVRDLSLHGFCARLLSGDVTHIEQDFGQPTPCEIDLPGHGTLRAVVEVRHILPSRARSAPRVGARFLTLDPASERQLENCVTALDFERIRPR
jgi:c-di-GMP-binding flagellar brake protein YcgR